MRYDTMLRGRLACGLAAALSLGMLSTTSAQVVDLATGGANYYYANFAADGVANAASPNPQSWNSYRKGSSGNAPPLPTAADNGDGSSVTWSGISHGGNATNPDCCGNPGMFIGASPSTSSYDGAQVFFGTNTELGNEMDGATEGRRRFDLRFGFTESPDDWVAGKSSDSGDFDLWTADHGSDTVYLNFQIGNTDDASNTFVAAPSSTPGGASQGNLKDPTNRYVNISSALKGQSGAEPVVGGDPEFRGEQDRNRWIDFEPTNWRQIEGSFSNFEPTVVDHSQPDLNILIDGTGGNLATMDSGIPLDENVPVRWWMELADPDNADPVLSRMVNFHIQAGDVQYTQMFDPGGKDTSTTADDQIPNTRSNASGGHPFEDGFFDWENATPLFFVGPSGGADITGEIVMGFTNEGGPIGPVGPVCDANGDGVCDSADIDTLYTQIGSAGSMDLDGSGTVDADDIDDWLAAASDTVAETYVRGDVNLDGTVNSTDLGLLLNNFNDTSMVGYSGGNLNGDANVDSTDLGLLLNNFGATSASNAAVPEPSGIALLLLGVVGLLRRRR